MANFHRVQFFAAMHSSFRICMLEEILFFSEVFIKSTVYVRIILYEFPLFCQAFQNPMNRLKSKFAFSVYLHRENLNVYLDYDESYSLLVRRGSLRYVFAIFVDLNLHTEQIYAVTAFLQAQLPEKFIWNNRSILQIKTIQEHYTN